MRKTAYEWGVMHAVEAKGARIPLVGLGTWELRAGDAAEMYDNERGVGEGLRASGVARDEVFLTTKIWPSHFAPLELERAAKASLGRLRLEQLDLLLLHWP